MLMTRKGFLGFAAPFVATAGFAAGDALQPEGKKVIQSFELGEANADPTAKWTPFSDRRVKVGIAGEGVCSFGSAFGYQNHPNVEVIACADVQPANLRRLQERVKAPKAYASCEEMIAHAADDGLEAVYIATDAPSHARLAILALDHGLHVASAVPAVFGTDQLELVPKLIDAVRRSGKVYQMNETSAFRADCYAMRKLYEAGCLGALTYAEGEYFHPSGNSLDATGSPSYKRWRFGMPPQFYPTHSNAYYTCVTHKRFTEVTCRGVKSLKHCYAKGNRYGNPFGSEYAMFLGEDGSSSRMLVAWDTPAYGAEVGRVWGQKGCYVPEKGGYSGWFDAEVKASRAWLKPQLPPGMPAGGHGGSHGYLTDDFIRAILLKDHAVCVDVVTALNTTVSGIYAHLSAMKDGESLKIPTL